MSTSDGSIVGTTQILNNGSPIYRYNIVLLSEGYQNSQLGQFANDAQAFVNRLSRTPPFHLLMNSINVFRVDVSSTDSGADDPMACTDATGTGATARTYFDATFCSGGQTRRLLTVNDATALQVAAAQVPRYRLVVVIVNSPLFGGSGGSVAVYSLAAGAVGIALHEIGHTAFALADEYEYYLGCGSGETDRNSHPPVEPAAPNVTISSDRNGKASKVTKACGSAASTGIAGARRHRSRTSAQAQAHRWQRDRIGFSWRGVVSQAIQAYTLRHSTVISGVRRKIISAPAPLLSRRC